MCLNSGNDSYPGKTGILAGIMICALLTSPVVFSQPGHDYDADLVNRSKPSSAGLAERFQCFEPIRSNATYSISLCADLPDNNYPKRIYVGDETGHVFIILTKQTGGSGGTVIAQSFGFYPRRPASSLIFKNVRPEILDNGNREYNACVTKLLTPADFVFVLEKAVLFSAKKYNINRFNCYDYALEVFNSLPGIEKIPVRHIKFPFVIGYGGSPCGLYEDLLQLKTNGSSWASFIQIGIFRSPRGQK